MARVSTKQIFFSILALATLLYYVMMLRSVLGGYYFVNSSDEFGTTPLALGPAEITITNATAAVIQRLDTQGGHHVNNINITAEADTINNNSDSDDDDSEDDDSSDDEVLQGNKQVALPHKNHDAGDDLHHDPGQYTVIIFHYHKTGYAVSTKLKGMLLQEGKDRKMKLRSTNSYPKREHDKNTKCPLFRSYPGNIIIHTAPDLFCSVEELYSALSPPKRMSPLVRPRYKGIKIIHLVRNPYNMALSNYFYHAQIPTPEAWVTRTHVRPCDDQYSSEQDSHLFVNGTNHHNDYHGNKVLLKTTNIEEVEEESLKSLILPALPSISSYQFDKAHSMCESLFQNKNNTDLLLSNNVSLHTNGTATSANTSDFAYNHNIISSLQNATFYQHLIHLNDHDGLRLATAQIMLGSGKGIVPKNDTKMDNDDNDEKILRRPTRKKRKRQQPSTASGGDILRMGNNIAKLNQLIKFHHDTVKNSKEKEDETTPFDFQLLTMEMSQWIYDGFNSTMKVFDFVFGDSIPTEDKHAMAELYQKSHQETIAINTRSHITTGKAYGKEKKKELIAMLRDDESLGPMLDVVEGLVNDALQLQ